MKKDDLQKITEKALVPVKHYEMLYLRFMGLTYKKIAEQMGYTHDTVRGYFAKGGRLHELYRLWVETAKKNAIEESLDMMYGHLPDIVRSRIVLAKSMGKGSNEAAKMIFSYTLGNPDKNVVSSQTNVQVNNNQVITGFEYIVPVEPNHENTNQTDVETASGVAGGRGSDN
jgi:hypothetical protein